MDSQNEFSSTSAGHLHEATETTSKHKSDLLDQGLDESFPASDPTAISITRIIQGPPLVATEDIIKR